MTQNLTMSSPQSTCSSSPYSDSSFPSSLFSEVSTASSCSDDLSEQCHLLVVSPPCESMSTLDAFLRKLPLCSTEPGKQYLLLALGHTYASSASERFQGLNKSIGAIGSILGNESMFKSWSSSQFPGIGYFISGSGETSSIDVEAQSILQAKITSIDALNVFSSAGLHLVYYTSFSGSANDSDGTLYLLERAPFSFPPLTPLELDSGTINTFGPPSREEWRTLWEAWDLVTLGMIPTEMLHQKPIDLRHKCLFYIGHIPTFLNILLSHLFKESYTEPMNFTQIFERGIDPHVDDPNHCHSHSEIPEADEDWPTLASILEYRDRVRARLMQVYDDIDAGRRTLTRSLARVLQMTLEHEGFHIEAQAPSLRRASRPPPWSALAAQWARAAVPASPTVELGPARLILGHDNSEAEDDVASGSKDVVHAHAFGWDNESPARAVEVARFRAEWRPVTNGEYLVFWKERGEEFLMPASWVEERGEIFVRTVYGAVPILVAANWPVLASYDQLSLATAGLADGPPGWNGGVWEWTSTIFDSHPGLSPTKHFPGYSTDFFDGKHQVVLGASYATMPRLAGRRTVRNFYQHNYPYAWVSARVVYDVNA
ncbi:hypothetical protein EW145_g2415 [Phellinidium pouzarii]|uniref:Sulfatase-modifying factor enzyme domain-containing protein n=1 Tax=Phellinidium pouzarii TaxID=167371 RepID=A0A4S4LCG1_9AGAM|nr:hypothetical protein EW145_g2415 [Phellinidium pouzarii]